MNKHEYITCLSSQYVSLKAIDKKCVFNQFFKIAKVEAALTCRGKMFQRLGQDILEARSP